MISVCMATCNGEKFIRQQLDSILCQLGEADELIISDDGSTDGTLEIVGSYKTDPRIKVLKGGFHSPIYNFENAIRHAAGDYIFMSDQDDIWLEGRVRDALAMHERGIDLVICMAQNIDAAGKVIKEMVFDDRNPVRHSLLRNLYRNPYLGCCMSFNRRVSQAVLPFPQGIAMHDIWIGLVTQTLFRCDYLGERPLVQYRRHGVNFTEKNKYNFWGKINYRAVMIAQVLKRVDEIKRRKTI